MVKVTKMDEILQRFKKAKRAVFRTREYAALLGKKNYARLVLHRLKERGEIEPIKNGWWAFAGEMHEAIACEISQPCYISFHSALYLHGLTTQIPGIVRLAVCRTAHRYEVFGTPVQEYRVKPKQFNGFKKMDGILIATPEKALADCLNIPKACITTILVESLEGIDAKKVNPFLSKNGLKRFRRLLKHAG